MAVSMLRQNQVKKIVLVRPAVEAGERLGFLPGDIVAKINPYLRPLFDALNDMMEPEQVKRYMENDIIEIVPLAYMRGRTLNNAVIILDEGQNTTVAADEDVPDAHGQRLEDHRDGRRHAGRSAAADAERADRRRSALARRGTNRHRLPRRARYRPQSAGAADPAGLRGRQAPQEEGVRNGQEAGWAGGSGAARRRSGPLTRQTYVRFQEARRVLVNGMAGVGLRAARRQSCRGLWRRGNLVRLAAVLLTTLAATGLAYFCGPSHPFRVGQVFRYEIRSRVYFEMLNQAQTLRRPR